LIEIRSTAFLFSRLGKSRAARRRATEIFERANFTEPQERRYSWVGRCRASCRRDRLPEPSCWSKSSRGAPASVRRSPSIREGAEWRRAKQRFANRS
jgi:hypothetical protein